jgi:hypothetical protein
MSDCKHEPDWGSAVLVGPSQGCTPPVVDVACAHCGNITGVALSETVEWDEAHCVYD